MPNSPSDVWERLGENLVRRRLKLAPRYRDRKAFTLERAPGLYGVLSDIELGKRSSYEPSTLAAIEAAYQLERGSIGRFLNGGTLEPADIGSSEPAGASAQDAPEVIRVLAEVSRNTAEEVAEMTALADTVKGVIAAARAYQPYGRLDGHRLFPGDSAQDQRLARAWNVLNPMGLDDELQASIAASNVVSQDATAFRERSAEGGRAGGASPQSLDEAGMHPHDVKSPARPSGQAPGAGPVRPTSTDGPSVPGPPGNAVGGAGSVPEPEPIGPAERFARPDPITRPVPIPEFESPPAPPEPESASAPEPEPPESLEPTYAPEQQGPLPVEPASDDQPAELAPGSSAGGQGQTWAVLYDDGMSLTTASERIARSLAETERQHGRRVIVRRSDDAGTHPRNVSLEPTHTPGQRADQDVPDLAVSQHETGPRPCPPAEEPHQAGPGARSPAPPSVLTQALPAASPAPSSGATPTSTLWPRARQRFWPATTGWRVISALILATVLLCGAAVTVALTRGPTAGQEAAGAAARTAAAAWIAQQVAPAAIVACDPQMCAVLQSKGIPASRLLMLGAGNAGPLGSDVIVSTAAVREEFGSRLTSMYAPVALASFGSGNAQVEIRVVAADGSAAYLRSLHADVDARRAAGALLLRNPDVRVSPGARGALAAGQVDARLLSLIGTLATPYHVDIAGFGAPAAGASPGVPLRSADISPAPAGRGNDAATLNSMKEFLLAQHAPFRPANVTIVRLASGQTVLHLEFTAPSPLALLGAPD